MNKFEKSISPLVVEAEKIKLSALSDEDVSLHICAESKRAEILVEFIESLKNTYTEDFIREMFTYIHLRIDPVLELPVLNEVEHL